MAFRTNPKLHSRAGGKPTAGEFIEIPEAANQSYLMGELVKLVAGAATVLASDEATSVYAQAQEDASGTTGTMQKFIPILPGDVWEFTTTATVTEAMRGIKYALTVTSNVHYIDCTDTSHDLVSFISPVYDKDGALQAKALFSFLPTVCQYVAGT